MKRLVFFLGLTVALFYATNQLQAQLLFQAFTAGEKPFPNAAVENPDEWNKRNVTAGKNIFQAADGRLKQISNDCATSTKTPFPVNGDNWTDYTIVLDVWDRDNDSFSILFRYTDENNYYNFTVGASDFGNTWRIGKATARENDCFDGGAPSLATGPNGLIIDESGKTAYTMMVRVKGPKIEVFFGPQVPRKEILAGKTPEKLGEAADDAFKKGTAGLHFGSNPADMANILVFGPGGPLSVEAKGKLSTVWGALKSIY
jgi:hypothetical protein